MLVNIPKKQMFPWTKWDTGISRALFPRKERFGNMLGREVMFAVK